MGAFASVALSCYMASFAGPEVPSKGMESTERYPRSTAYQEAGHAVVAFALGLPVGAISVRADDAGGTTEIEAADRLSLIDQIALVLGWYRRRTAL